MAEPAILKATRREQRSIRIAARLFLVNGVAWGLGAVPYAIYIHRLGRLPISVGGFESMSGPISDRFGSEAVAWLLIPMGLLAWIEVLTGWWLRHDRKEGAWLALLLLPASMFFWIGFMMPIWIVLGPARIALVMRGWNTLG